MEASAYQLGKRKMRTAWGCGCVLQSRCTFGWHSLSSPGHQGSPLVLVELLVSVQSGDASSLAAAGAWAVGPAAGRVICWPRQKAGPGCGPARLT